MPEARRRCWSSIRKEESARHWQRHLVTGPGVRAHQIRLGIDAPRSITVHRQEDYIQVARENRLSDASADRGFPSCGPPVPQAVASRRRPDIAPTEKPRRPARAPTRDLLPTSGSARVPER